MIVSGGIGATSGLFSKNLSLKYSVTQGNIEQKSLPESGYQAGYLLPISMEVALHNKWGVGLSFSQNGYWNTRSDQSRSTNVGLFGAFHFVSSEKVELYTRLHVGFSRLVYNESEDLYVYDDYPYYEKNIRHFMSGGFVKPSLGIRIFFNEHVGMFIDEGIGEYLLRGDKYKTQRGTYRLDNNIRLIMISPELTVGLAYKL